MFIRIEKGPSLPISRQIADQVRALCLIGTLRLEMAVCQYPSQATAYPDPLGRVARPEAVGLERTKPLECGGGRSYVVMAGSCLCAKSV